MHTIKITPNLLFEYQCTRGKFIILPNRKNRFGSENRIETFCLNWNALAPHTPTHARVHGCVQWEYFLRVHMDGGN